MMRYIIFSLLILVIATAFNANAVSVIVHPSNGDALNKKALKKIFLGKSKKFPSGNQVIPIDLSSGEARKEFLKGVIGKSESQIKAYWSKLVFTGKGQAPKSVDSDAEVIALISNNPDTIGYVADSAVTDAVKVVAKF